MEREIALHGLQARVGGPTIFVNTLLAELGRGERKMRQQKIFTSQSFLFWHLDRGLTISSQGYMEKEREKKQICRKEHKVYSVQESYVTKYVERSTRYILYKSLMLKKM